MFPERFWPTGATAYWPRRFWPVRIIVGAFTLHLAERVVLRRAQRPDRTRLHVEEGA